MYYNTKGNLKLELIITILTHYINDHYINFCNLFISFGENTT
jgi:hypothetical protein